MEENRMLMDDARASEPEEEALEAREEQSLGEVREELERALEEKLRQLMDEAARVAGMSGDERAAYETARRESDLDAREKQVTRRELRADAVEALEARGLPKALADAVSYDSREAMTQSVDAVERCFREAVQAAVEERLRGTSPAAGASAQGTDPDQMDDETYYRMAGSR